MKTKKQQEVEKRINEAISREKKAIKTKNVKLIETRMDACEIIQRELIDSGLDELYPEIADKIAYIGVALSERKKELAK